MRGQFYKNIEDIAAQNMKRALDSRMNYDAQELLLLRPRKSGVYNEVHGRNANTDFSDPVEFIGIIQADDFSSSDSVFEADFESGFLYAPDTDLKTGDVIQLKSGVRRWKLELRKDIGYSENVLTFFTLSNIT